MITSLNKTIRLLIPPILQKAFILIFKRNFSWRGNYKFWEEATKLSSGYDNDQILEKVKNSILKVKNGEAACERDSVIFNKIEYSWPLITGLLLVAGKNQGRLNVLDFGGSLGSTYFQNKLLLGHLNQVQWNIVEQKHFVECGKKYLNDSHLRFYYTIEDCLNENQIDVIICSGVLQCLENPFTYCKLFLEKEIKYIIIDRTGIINGKNHRLTIQTVPSSIYKASYPIWFFNEELFLAGFMEKYNLIYDFDSQFDPVACIDFHAKIKFKGFFFEKITS